MKSMVIFVVLLILFSNVYAAEDVIIPETFETDEKIIGESETTYFYAGSKLLASKDSSGLNYHYQDRLGSDVDSKSLPFGQSLKIGERFSFTGKELDEDLYYFNARYYDSSLGRFTSVDPVPSQPAYQYVANNPIKYVDPTGTVLDMPFSPNKAEQEMLSTKEGRDAYNRGVARGFMLGGMVNTLGIGFGGLSGSLARAFGWGISHPVETAVIGGTVANALDENPAADHLAGIPGDEVGNVIGAGARGLFGRVSNFVGGLGRMGRNTDDIIEVIQVGTTRIRRSLGAGEWEWIDDPIYDTVVNGRRLGEEFVNYVNRFGEEIPFPFRGEYTDMAGETANTVGRFSRFWSRLTGRNVFEPTENQVYRPRNLQRYNPKETFFEWWKRMGSREEGF